MTLLDSDGGEAPELTREEVENSTFLQGLKNQRNSRKSEKEKRVQSSLRFLSLFKLHNSRKKKSVSPLTVQQIKKIVKKQLSNEPRITNDLEQFSELYNLMENTVKHNEGNSTLLIGPRGCGKTTLINKCLEQLKANYDGEYFTFRLNSFIHSDDNSAIREIASQFTKFFGLNETTPPIEVRQLTTTFKNTLRILEPPQDEGAQNIPMIFVIDDLEAFTDGNKQILLYNLFEMTQSSQTPIFIVGTSTRFTTRELLEKRVRSRFSQRLIIMNKIASFEEFSDHCLNNLRLTDEAIASLEEPEIGKSWNEHLNSLAGKDNDLTRVLRLNFNTTRNIKQFNNCAFLPVSKVTPEAPYFSEKYLKVYLKHQMKNSIQEIVRSSSRIEQLLLIAAARFIEKSNLVSVNFSIAYKEYTEMIKQLNVDRSVMRSTSSANHNMVHNLQIDTAVWGEKVLKNCWISLYKTGILIDYHPNTAAGGILTANSNKYYMVKDTYMLQLDVTLAELNQLLGHDSMFKHLTRL